MMKEIEEYKFRFGKENTINISSLAAFIETQAKLIKKYKVRFITFILDKSPEKIFNEWIDPEYSFSVKKFEDFYNVSLTRLIGGKKKDDEKRTLSGNFCLFPINHTNVWVGFTSDSSDFFKYGLVRFIETYKPVTSRIYLSSKEMRNLFEELEEALSCEIYVKKAVLYSHIEEGHITFEKSHFQNLFNKAENENQYIDKIEYSIIKENQIIYHGFISRDGIVYYNSGKINYLFNSIIPLIANRGKIKSGMFRGKERHFGKIEISPIDIDYNKSVFNNGKDNLRLIKALLKVSRGAVAVYHKNPYLHATFLDFIDGSNFDIFVTSSNSISIVPNFKCSVHSLMRVCEQISKDFNEGDINISEEMNVTLETFIGD